MMKEHKKLYKAGKNWIAATIVVAAMGGVTASQLDASADTVHVGSTDVVSNGENKQTAYQQKAAQNKQQLASVASDNAAKEQAAADSYASANAANKEATDSKVAAIQQQQAALKKENAAKIAAASAAMNSTIAAQTSAINAQASEATASQAAANANDEAAMRSANAAKMAQTEAQASEVAANVAQEIADAKSEFATTTAAQQASRDEAIKAANDAYDNGVKKENESYATKRAAIAKDITAAKDAVDVAQKDADDHAVTTIVMGKKSQVKPTDFAEYINGPWDKARWNKKEYFDTMAGEYTGFDLHRTVFDSEIDFSHAPHNVDEMVTDFKPGLIIYDAWNDNSEAVSKDGLNEEQRNILRAFMTSWTNGFRDYIYHHDPAIWDKANNNKDYKTNALQQIRQTDKTIKIGEEVGHEREQAGLNNHTHSIENGVMYSHNFENAMGKEMASASDTAASEFNKQSWGYKTAHPIMICAGDSNAIGENLMTMSAQKPTILSYLVNAYNMMQSMYYGEIFNDTPGSINIGGHTANVLRGNANLVAIGFQKLTKDTYREYGVNGLEVPTYAVTFDFAQDTPYVLGDGGYMSPETIEKDGATEAIQLMKECHKIAGNDLPQNQQLEDAKNVERYGIGWHKKITVPKQYADALTNAKDHLTAVHKTDKANNSDHQIILTTLAENKANAIETAKQTFEQATEAAAKTRDNKIKTANSKLIDVNAVKKQLDANYAQLVKDDQAKIAAIETKRQNDIKAASQAAHDTYDATVKRLGIDDSAAQAKIDGLLKNHEDFVKKNADALAQLKAADTKAYNDLKARLDAELAALLPKKGQSAHQAAVDRAKQEVAQAEKDYRQHADAFAKQQQVVNEKRAALESVKKEIATTPMWSASQAQQLAAFVAQYGKQNDLKFYQYDGKTSFSLGDNYPNFNSLHVKGNSSATIGMSTNGAGNYDYNVVAVFNHTPTNSKQFIEWHDTYFFAFHNGQPVVLVDYSTNGKPALVDVSQVTSKYSGRLNAFQNEFAALVGKVQNANKEKLQQAQADFDNANSKLAELTTGKDNAAQALQDAQAELAAVNGDRTAGSHRMADVVNGKTNVMTLQGHGASASVSLADSKQATGTSSQSSLPQTGNKESAAALALGAVSAMFGLGLMKKREY
ncbi:DUF4767 domain-containing protein [Limosilactobacillus caccae]|uniref:DUF4767 domain-containing protein n=1 Tax=Limosilactobacillus caccae TaxID=1926284 RepID=UPI00097060C3|nr:DUF4767 domain-containing protein [Limosilactobacillus caccae]